MLSNFYGKPVPFEKLNEDTASYFMKAADHNILEFVFSEKVILVEGDAEYMLMSKMFKAITGRKEVNYKIHIISVNGISFKRYLDLAKLLSIKTAVIRDNDNDYQKNCIENYEDYSSDLIQVFADDDNNRSTFEIAMYLDNKVLCDKLFSIGRRKLTVQEYMLKNKTDAAFALLESNEEIKVPEYIGKAIEWTKN